ncbi:MAG: hypothetical protein K5931_04015, partial [Lachnospiraceae bacterium]|nr:hypothetical protein [Lachnospiraceae bacterium]
MFKRYKKIFALLTMLLFMTVFTSINVYATDINSNGGVVNTARNFVKGAAEKLTNGIVNLSKKLVKGHVELIDKPVAEGVLNVIDDQVFNGEENNEYPKMMIKMMAQSASYSIAEVRKTGNEFTMLVAFAESTDRGVYAQDQSIKKTYNIFCIIASFWCIAVAMGNYFKNVQQGREPLDAAFQIVAEIGIVGVLLINTPKILEVIVNLGLEIFSAAVGFKEMPLDALSDEQCEEILETMTGAKTGHFFWNCQAVIQLILPFIISFVTQLVAVIMYLSICFEIFLTRFFVPFAITDIYQEGLRSPGFRYLKKFFGRYVRLATIFIILRVADILFKNNVELYFQGGTAIKIMMNIGIAIAMQVSVILLMSKSNEI